MNGGQKSNQSAYMSNITTKSNALPLAIVEKHKEAVIRWQKHFSGDIAARIPSNMITVETGMTSPPLMILKQTQPRELLIAILAKQIESFALFFNVARPMSADQILDLAEVIHDENDDLSYEAFQDCLNRLKTGKYPFENVKIYSGIGPADIVRLLRDYRDIQCDVRERNYQQEKSKYQFASSRTGDITNIEKEAHRAAKLHYLKNHNPDNL